jgi:hypothetical protein
VVPLVEVPWGAGPLHSLLAPTVVLGIVMAATTGRRLVRRRWLGLPIGMYLHLVLDLAWTRSETFWWPFLGPALDWDTAFELDRGLVSVVMEVVAVAVGWLLGELISPIRLVVIAILLAAQVAILWRDRGLWVLQRGALRFMPFLVGIIWGTYFPLYGIAIHEFGFWRTLVSTEWGVLILAIAWAVVRPNGRWDNRFMWRNMAEQSVLSSMGQALSGAALWWGGVIVHSILTNFNVLVNVSAFRIRFGEALQPKYVLYFVLYVALAIILVWGS